MAVAAIAFFFTAWLAIAIAFAAWLAGIRRIQNRRRRVNFLLGIVLVSSMVLFPVMTSADFSGLSSQGTQLPLAECRGLRRNHLPPQIDRVTYYSNAANDFVAFPFTETRFKQWAAGKSWEVESISYEEWIDFRKLGLDLKVTNGLVVEERFHDRGTGVRAVFDRDTGTCYYHYSHY